MILLDLMLPEMNGFEVCKLLRDKGRSTPVLIITAREEEKDKILGLDLGADDYITKPFSIRELMARVKANIRRVAMVSQAQPELLADVMRERPGKCCAVCGKPVYSSSNRAKYCPACAKQERRKQDAKRKREQYWNLRK